MSATTANEKKELFDITVSEVSLCDSGANQGARVMLFKRDLSTDQRTSYVELAARIDKLLTSSREILKRCAVPIDEPLGADNMGIMTIEKANNMLAIAKRGDAKEIRNFNKGQWLDAVEELSKQHRRPGETASAAALRVKIWQTHPELRAAYKNAPPAPSEEPEGPSVADLYPSLVEAHRRADELLKENPKLTVEQARAEIWRTHPALRMSYNTELRAARGQ